ncbi:MAG TPA: ATP-binding protein [Flavisolibacter sp.]|nr:ATP-binding protein [Flavisolibacter sp.]
MSRKTLYAFIVSFILLLSVIILNRLSFDQMRSHSNWVDHTRQVITLFETISNHFKSAQIYTPSYDSLAEKKYYDIYYQEASKIERELNDLKKLVADNDEQVRLVNSLSTLIKSEMGVLMKKNIAEIIVSGESWRLNVYTNVSELIAQGIRREESLLKMRTQKLRESTRLNNLFTTAFGVIALGIIIFTFLSNLFLSKQRNWLEGFLESILNTSRNGILYYKAVRKGGRLVDFRIDFINKAGDELLGRSFASKGKNLSELPLQPEERTLLEQCATVLQTGNASEVETVLKWDGPPRWFFITFAPLNDGVTATFHDITRLKEAEEALRQKINDLERSNTELEQYAYVASHDLQEPLRKIRSFGSYLQDTQSARLDEKGKEQLEKIMSSAERMSALIKDILSFSSLDKEVVFVPVNLNDILSNVLQDLDLLITQKKARVESEQLPIIQAIPLQMTQLFYNLVNNSLKFANQQRPLLIRIECAIAESHERPSSLPDSVACYRIRFIDNGIGFGQEYAGQIFGLFKRLNDKQRYPGSGIGLALCRKVVENHQGEIKASGKESEGAVFTIYLPESQPG